MTERSDGWARLTADVESLGEGDMEVGASELLDIFCHRVAEGHDPKVIAKSRGYTWFVLRKWLEDDARRMDSWALAKRCFADGLQYEALDDVKAADTVNVGVQKLLADHKTRLSGKLNRDEWGEKQIVDVRKSEVSIKVLLDRREERLRSVMQDRLADAAGASVLECLPAVMGDHAEEVI